MLSSRTNPHLAGLRKRLNAPDAENEIYWALRGCNQWHLSLTAWGREIPVELDHARRVLSRLARISGDS